MSSTDSDPHLQVNGAKRKLSDAEIKAEQYAKDTSQQLKSKVDKFDQKVEEGASKAKSGLSGWFK